MRCLVLAAILIFVSFPGLFLIKSIFVSSSCLFVVKWSHLFSIYSRCHSVSSLSIFVSSLSCLFIVSFLCVDISQSYLCLASSPEIFCLFVIFFSCLFISMLSSHLFLTLSSCLISFPQLRLVFCLNVSTSSCLFDSTMSELSLRFISLSCLFVSKPLLLCHLAISYLCFNAI